MSQRISRQELKRDEFVDAAVDAGHWIEVHWRKVVLWAAAAVVVALAVTGWILWSRHSLNVTEERLAEAIVEFERVQSEGFSDRAGVDRVLASLGEIVERAGSAPPGLVARMYRGAGLLQSDRASEATAVLEELVKQVPETGSSLIGPAHGLLARSYQAEGRTDEAIELLRGVLQATDPAVPVDQTLFQLGKLYQSAARDAEAREQFQRIVDEHPTGAAAQAARQELEP